MKNLGQKPSADKISFADECFEVVGKEAYYTVSNENGYGYPRVFKTRGEAEANCHGCQVIHRHERLVKERIKWTP